MPINESGANVPLQSSPRLLYVHNEPTWLIQRGKAATNLSGVVPEVSNLPVSPAIQAGAAIWDSLDDGGLFTFQSCGHAIVIEQVATNLGNGSSALVIIDVLGKTRSLPTAPFKLAAGETIQATTSGVSGSNKAEVGLLVRLDGQKVF